LSRIHEALRRGMSSAQRSSAGTGSAHADTVLATLGYQAESSIRSRKRFLWALIATIVLAAGYTAWSLWPFPRSKPAQAAVHAPPPAQRTQPVARTPPPAPVQPASQPTASTASETRAHASAQASPAAVRASDTMPAMVRRQPGTAAPSIGRDEFQLALYYQRAGEFDRALVHYRGVLQRDELNVEAHNNLGLLYKDKGLGEEAIGEFRRALSISPRYVRAHNNLGVTLLESGRIDAAVAEFRSALDIDPKNVDALVNIALAERSAGRTMDARGSLVRALAIEPHSAAAHYNLGLQYEDSGETSRAIEHYEAFLRYAGPEYSGRAPDVRARITALQARIR
jgi:Tfp pilus assembly protein PilF